MAGHNNSKYDRREVEKLITSLGFEVDRNNGKALGKGAHIVYSHYLYEDLKINIPAHNKTLKENEMSNICGNLIIVMEILGLDTSRFSSKEGVEGKLMKTAKAFKKNPCILFTPIVKHCLGLNDEEDILEYIEKTKKKIEKTNSKTKK